MSVMTSRFRKNEKPHSSIEQLLWFSAGVRSEYHVRDESRAVKQQKVSSDESVKSVLKFLKVKTKNIENNMFL